MLKIVLKPGETLIVNGALIRASQRSEFVVENRVALLRGREVMQPTEVTSPARRLYFSAMMAYVDIDQSDLHRDRVVSLLHDLIVAFEVHEAKAACATFARQIAEGDYYAALATCRGLIALEDQAVARGSQAA